MKDATTLTPNARRASNCLWATPTIFLTRPFWFDAEASPWTCLRDTVPQALATTARCADCSRWEGHEPRQQH